jgi:acetyl-CoA carboxylase, biotin carboxylase subunit
MADEAVCIGPAPSTQSYLSMPNIISAALTTGAEAIHPGYGFLAENARFARAVADSGLTFIGPSPEAIERMGDKAVARRDDDGCRRSVRAWLGGESRPSKRRCVCRGGRFPGPHQGLGRWGRQRVCASPPTLHRSQAQFVAARNEAAAAFGDDTVYIERYLLRPRHIEFQVLADTHGNAIHLFERDCSIQRRHQKLIEEAPSPALTPEIREAMGEAALRAVRAVDYVNAGTVEFLLDTDGSFYFMEMNTRVQVEHPVTEQITGVDIVKEQIRIAAGEPMKHATRTS